MSKIPQSTKDFEELSLIKMYLQEKASKTKSQEVLSTLDHLLVELEILLEPLAENVVKDEERCFAFDNSEE